MYYGFQQCGIELSLIKATEYKKNGTTKSLDCTLLKKMEHKKYEDGFLMKHEYYLCMQMMLANPE